MELHHNIFIIFNIMFTLGAPYQVERTKINTSEFSQSIDSFTNTNVKHKETFCMELNGTCSTQSCEMCHCSKGDVWLSYHHGCKRKSYLHTIDGIDDKRCFTIDPFSTWIPTISLNTSRTKHHRLYKTVIFPNNIDTKNNECELKSLRQISNGTVTLAKDFVDAIELKNSVAFKTIKFTEKFEMNNLTGMLLVLDIECVDRVQTSTFKSCFIFKVEGTQDIKAIPIPPGPTGGSGKKDDGDDDVMDIVKPVVIVGSIFLVFVGVGFYCIYKRNKFIKQQNERKISEAQVTSERKSVVTMSGYVGNAASDVARMSTATILPNDSSDVFVSPDHGVQNGGYAYVDTNFINKEKDQQINDSEAKTPPLPETGYSQIHHNNTTDNQNNNNNNNINNGAISPINTDYHELEKDDSPDVKRGYQDIDISRSPNQYEELNKPVKVNDIELGNQKIDDNEINIDNQQSTDKETTNPYYNPAGNIEITGDNPITSSDSETTEKALYEEVMEEYNRITSLPRAEKKQALGEN